MTDLTDQQIEALDAAATPGPWESCDASGEWFTHPPATGSFLVNDGRTHEQKRADAVFIAAARSLVPSLLARAQKAEAEADELRRQLLDETYHPEGGEIIMRELRQAKRERDALAARAQRAEDDAWRWHSERDKLRATITAMDDDANQAYVDRDESEEWHAQQVDALAARLASAEAKLTAVGEWAMANECAASPLDWAGLGAALAADATPEPTFERLLSDPNTIVWLKDHGTPEVRRTFRELEASIEAYRNAPSNTISVPPSAIPEQEAGNDE